MSENSSTLDLAKAGAATFAAHVGSAFTLRDADGREREIRLEDVVAPSPELQGEGRPFSLIFRCEETLLPASIYRLSHPELPSLEIFLSPFEGTSSSCRLEAVFN